MNPRAEAPRAGDSNPREELMRISTMMAAAALCFAASKDGDDEDIADA